MLGSDPGQEAEVCILHIKLDLASRVSQLPSVLTCYRAYPALCSELPLPQRLFLT